MKTDRPVLVYRLGMVFGTAVCLASLSACSGTRELSDVQLTRLLRVERASAADPRAPIDSAAVNCLKAWSGDVELTANLSPAVSSEPAKNTCKQRLDGWIADAGRNPDKVRFEELSAAPSVRRAAALLIDHRAATMQLPSANDVPPAALARPNQAPETPAPSGPVDVSAATAAVDELEKLCQQAKQAEASGQDTEPLARYASYCEKRIEQMRTRISAVVARGDSRQAQMVNENAQQTLAVGRQIAAQGKAPARNQ